MKRALKSLETGPSLPVLLLADISNDSPLGVSLGRKAAAFVGAPMTPGSVVGVARRTTRRTVAVTASASSAAAECTAQQQQAVAQQQAQAASSPPIGSMVTTLPAGCVASSKGGVEYHKCGTVYYRAGFQGDNLVYVVQQQP